jgi:hypothetical protein
VVAVIERGKGGGGFKFSRFLFAFVVLLMALGGWVGLFFLFEPNLFEVLKSLPENTLYFLLLIQGGYFFGGLFILYSMVKRGKLTSLEVLAAVLLNLALLSPLIFKLM